MTEIVLGSKADEKENGLDRLREKYKGEGSTIYEVTSVITEDDDSERAVTYLFKKPTTASYDRYVKTAAASSSRALTRHCWNRPPANTPSFGTLRRSITQRNCKITHIIICVTCIDK